MPVTKLFALVFLALTISAQAQSYSSQQIELAERLNSLSKNAAPETAYIQTSKDIYETGEDLWFKVYLLDAQNLAPSLLSQTLYLQLLNEKTGKIYWKEKYEIIDGFADGRVYLESKVPEGNYFLAAYTPNSFYDDSTEIKALRRIRVVNDIISVQEPAQQDNSTIKQNKIQFTTFPEGGTMVSGVQSKLAFKAVSRNGEPIDVTGILFQDSIPLVKFTSLHAGMGCFEFVPDIGKKYFIKLSKPASDSIFSLPEILRSGITLQLTGRDDDSVSFVVTQSPDLEEEDIYLRVQSRGIVYGMTSARLVNKLKIKLPLFDLPQGIAEVTLFNCNLKALSERLLYINRDKKLNITAELSKGIYNTREKAILKISVKDEYGDPVVSNLGISAFDKLYQNPQDSNNILTHYYLSTQLKGRIYNPTYYFNVSNKNREEALDLLMLTQGWRKYIWTEEALKKNVTPKEQVIFDGVKGNMYFTDRKKKIPKEQTFVMAFSPNKDSTNVLIPADSLGRFEVLPLELKKWEDDYVFMKPFGPRSSRIVKLNEPLADPEFRLHINFNDPFETITLLEETKVFTYPLPPLISEQTEKKESSIVNQGFIKIKEVTIKGQKGKIIRGKFLGSLDSLAKSSKKDDYVCVYCILNCPRHLPTDIIPPTEYPKFPCLEKRPIPGKQYWVIYNYNTPGEYTRRVTYFYPKYSEDDLLRINNLFRVKAYYGKREFYKPNYDMETGDAHLPDYRNTLLWEPSVITDENGEATLSFFCSDTNTDFVGRIEGVGGDGLLGSGFFKFTVRKLKLNP